MHTKKKRPISLKYTWNIINNNTTSCTHLRHRYLWSTPFKLSIVFIAFHTVLNVSHQTTLNFGRRVKCVLGATWLTTSNHNQQIMRTTRASGHSEDLWVKAWKRESLLRCQVNILSCWMVIPGTWLWRLQSMNCLI